jgi:hypothetical protein
MVVTVKNVIWDTTDIWFHVCFLVHFMEFVRRFMNAKQHNIQISYFIITAGNIKEEEIIKLYVYDTFYLQLIILTFTLKTFLLRLEYHIYPHIMYTFLSK